jgi:hypothetical protein
MKLGVADRGDPCGSCRRGLPDTGISLSAASSSVASSMRVVAGDVGDIGTRVGLKLSPLISEEVGDSPRMWAMAALSARDLLSRYEVQHAGPALRQRGNGGSSSGGP